MPRRDQPLPEFPKKDKISLDKKFFENLRDRVETILPTAGDGIKVEKTDQGYGLKISTTVCMGKKITLNVCSNGTPAQIEVYGNAVA